jgi:hypothetical protein
MKHWTVIGSVFVLLLLVLVRPALAEKVYRWVDEAGVVHFSATPPEGGAEAVDLKYQRNPDPATAEERLEAYQADLDTRMAEEKKAADESRKASEEAAERQRLCRNARDVLESLSMNRTTRYKQDDGSYQRYSDEEYENRVAEARERIDEYCY